MREAEGDGDELMKQASELCIEAMTKTAEAESSPVGSETLDVSTGDSVFDENSVAPPSSRMERLKKQGLTNERANNLFLQNRSRKIVSNRHLMGTWKQ